MLKDLKLTWNLHLLWITTSQMDLDHR